MLGIKFIKIQPTEYVLQFKRGQIVREGVGLSFFYYAPTTSLVLVPIGTVDVPFIFEEVTSDFQEVSIQGQITYRITEPKKLSALMNFTLMPSGRGYVSDDPKKLAQRLVNHAQVLTRASFKSMTLRESLGQSDELVNTLKSGLQADETIASLGLEITGFSILAIRPTPETARALEAEAREQILRQADQAVYSRRNASVEQERAIKENELNTEIAVENKKRQIKETQMDAEKAVQQKKREIREAEMAAKISIEQKNKELVSLSTANAREEADAKAYAISAMMKALSDSDPKIVEAITNAGMKPDQLIAQAFKELAINSDKIGHLNMSPELLRELLDRKE